MPTLTITYTCTDCSTALVRVCQLVPVFTCPRCFSVWNACAEDEIRHGDVSDHLYAEIPEIVASIPHVAKRGCLHD